MNQLQNMYWLLTSYLFKERCVKYYDLDANHLESRILIPEIV